MYQYRISKYSPNLRDIQGHYVLNDWTDYSDIGSTFNGKRLSKQAYLRVEHAYLGVVSDVLQSASVFSMMIHDYEPRSWFSRIRSMFFMPRSLSSRNHILRFSRGCLRNNHWGKLVSDEMFIHFGYDYYMYIGSSLDAQKMQEIVSPYQLFCEETNSPYC